MQNTWAIALPYPGDDVLERGDRLAATFVLLNGAFVGTPVLDLIGTLDNTEHGSDGRQVGVVFTSGHVA
ncbi:hypothetical protein AU467_31310 [Mesorhizobium loti]|uniref:Uncharacterized protein n=1 Tax=Rhizobium loti TaxID=381 RepID=A0A124GFM3_RHILI|nr:hypothetical protein AU467_31310 [Mesorhizobium loti]